MVIPNPLLAGTPVSVTGTINSNYNITNVTARINNSSGGAVYTATASPNARTYNMNAMNNQLMFSQLPVGSYTFVVTATDASGTTRTLRNPSFTVEGFIWPVPSLKHRSNSPWGWRTSTSSWHRGIDNNHGCGKGNSCGTDCKVTIVASAAGTVEAATWDDSFGNFVRIRHSNGVATWYAHNHQNLVTRNQNVTQGQNIAIMGNTGNSEGPHLHFDLRTSSDLRVNALPGYHWNDHRSGSRNPNPLFVCTLCPSNVICRGRDTENSGNHNFVYNTSFSSAWFNNSNNSRWWQTTNRHW